MMFTALHRALGFPPGPITVELLDTAVEREIEEADDLDWKSKLPAAADLKNSDFSKDITAMANSGGGVIVYGVTENQKRANGRRDTGGELSEAHERSLHQIAVSAVSPPLFGLNVIQVGEDGNRAVVVVVPSSTEGPHLIYRGEYFGAPIRNNADTVWMREREVAAQYRARFDAAHNPSTYLYELYDETSTDRDTADRAWFIAVAHPKSGASRTVRWSQEQARNIFKDAEKYTLAVAPRTTAHPLEFVDRENPRPGLRRWIAPNTQITDSVRSAESWISVHFDGSVTLAAVVGGRYRNPPVPPHAKAPHTQSVADQRTGHRSRRFGLHGTDPLSRHKNRRSRVRSPYRTAVARSGAPSPCIAMARTVLTSSTGRCRFIGSFRSKPL